MASYRRISSTLTLLAVSMTAMTAAAAASPLLGGSPRADLVLPRDDASQTASGGAQALGLSAADLGYVLLALGALGVTGLITRRLARSATGPAGM